MSPYRVSPEAVEERLVELDAILAAAGKIVSFKTNDPKRLRYRLNEAIYAAKALEIEPYNSISIRLHLDPPFVHAVPKYEVVILSEIVDSIQAHVNLPESHIFDSTTEFEVVQTAMTNTELLELHFPKFAGKLPPVERFAKARGYEILTDPILVLRRVVQ